MDLVFLHGPAASGKLTTAREIERLVGYPVFHNHLVVDTLTTVFPYGSEPFADLRERFWLQSFEAAADIGRSLTFTIAPEPTVRAGFSARVRRLVEARGGRVCFVRLLVDRAEQERRVANPERGEFHKLSDVEVLRQLRESHEESEQPPADLTIDTGHSDAATSAAAIVERFELRPQARWPRYQ